MIHVKTIKFERKPERLRKANVQAFFFICLCPVHPAIAGGDTANFFLQLWGQLALF